MDIIHHVAAAVTAAAALAAAAAAADHPLLPCTILLGFSLHSIFQVMYNEASIFDIFVCASQSLRNLAGDVSQSLQALWGTSQNINTKTMNLTCGRFGIKKCAGAQCGQHGFFSRN